MEQYVPAVTTVTEQERIVQVSIRIKLCISHMLLYNYQTISDEYFNY